MAFKIVLLEDDEVVTEFDVGKGEGEWNIENPDEFQQIQVTILRDMADREEELCPTCGREPEEDYTIGCPGCLDHEHAEEPVMLNPTPQEALEQALAWCQQDRDNEDGHPTQEMLEARCEVLSAALRNLP